MNQSQDPVISWLLEGDPAIRWRTMRDLLGKEPDVWERERRKIATEGWGAQLLSCQDEVGTWGGGFYSPKWTSTTYTLLLLRRFGLPPGLQPVDRACYLLLENGYYKDGGINLTKSYTYSETCMTGMILSVLACFRYQDERLHHLVKHLFDQQMRDGGWNCQSYRDATHSSVHTTIIVLEGLREYEKMFPDQSPLVRASMNKGIEFLLAHKLYKSHHTGEVFDPCITRLSFPPRWHYDILRALDFFRECDFAHDHRLDDALEILRKKRRKDGRWPLQNRHPGRTFFELEQPGSSSRWNTLRALLVLRWAEADT